MDHDAARARFSALIDGALPAREAADVEGHLEHCAACRTDLAQLRATVRLLQEVEPVQVPEGFAAGVRGRLEQLSHAAPSRPWARWRITWPQIRWSWKTAAAAASVALVAIFAANLAREMTPTWRLRSQGERARWGDGRETSNAETNSRVNRKAAAPPQPSVDAVGQQSAVSNEPNFDRKVIRTGQLALEVEKFDEAARRLLTIAETAGGFIADSSYEESGGVPHGTFVLRVPANRFTDTVRQAEQLGTVQRRQISGQDVTEEFIDLDARVRNLERQEARLLTFMDRAVKIPDLMAIQQEVSRVRGEIERLKGRLRFLTNRVDLATIQADVSQKPKKQSGGFWDFDRTITRIQAAFLNTVREILGAVEGITAFAAAILPLVLLGMLGWGLFRRSSRRADRAA
jgi:hypothetical protein